MNDTRVALGNVPALNPRIMDFLYSMFARKSMFDPWDMPGIIDGMKEIANSTDHVCICVAGVAVGVKQSVKVAKHVNPGTLIKDLNSIKTRRNKGSRSESRSPTGWLLLAYIVLDTRSIDDGTIDDILRTCKMKRRAHDRIIALIDYAVKYSQQARVIRELIVEGNVWYMPPISMRLGSIPNFTQRLVERTQDDTEAHISIGSPSTKRNAVI